MLTFSLKLTVENKFDFGIRITCIITGLFLMAQKTNNFERFWKELKKVVFIELFTGN